MMMMTQPKLYASSLIQLLAGATGSDTVLNVIGNVVNLGFFTLSIILQGRCSRVELDEIPLEAYPRRVTLLL